MRRTRGAILEETNRKRYCQALTDKCKNGSKRRKDNLKEKYWIKTKGFKAVIEEIKQHMKSYNNRIKQFTQNLIFQYNQVALYDEISGKEKS